MPSKGSINFVEMHIEKMLLGLGAATLLGVAGWYALGPNKIEYDGRKVGPADLDAAIAAKARQMKDTYERRKPEPVQVPEYARTLRAQAELGIFGADPNEGARVSPSLPIATYFGQEIPQLKETAAAEQDIVLVNVLKPGKPVLQTGISLVQRRQAALEASTGTAAQPRPTPDVTPVNSEGLSWVTVASYYPREALKRDMTAARYAGHRARVEITAVEAQRQELLPTGGWSDWVDVPRSMATPNVETPRPVFDELTGNVLNQTELTSAIELIRRNQRLIYQPSFYALEKGDPWQAPPLPGLKQAGAEEEEEAEPDEPGGGKASGPRSSGQPTREDLKRYRDAIQAARDALRKGEWSSAITEANSLIRGEKAPRGLKRQAEKIAELAKVEMEREEARKRGAPETELVNPEGADRDPVVWVHDDSVEPGKTYRYRLRVGIWNPYVGKRAALRDPQAASQVTIAGEWSEPSEPVVVAPQTHFFARSRAVGDEPAVQFDVFTWHRGRWYRESFTAQVGDIVGGPKEVTTDGAGGEGRPSKEVLDFTTGALVLDIGVDTDVALRRSLGRGEFAYSDSRALTITYLDAADGQVRQRIDRVDRSDPKYLELRDQDY